MSWPTPTVVIPAREPEPLSIRRARLLRRVLYTVAGLVGSLILVWGTIPIWWDTDARFDPIPWLVLVLYIPTILLVSIVVPILTRPPCPACGQKAPRELDESRSRLTPGSRTLRYRCSHCRTPLRYARTSHGEECWVIHEVGASDD